MPSPEQNRARSGKKDGCLLGSHGDGGGAGGDGSLRRRSRRPLHRPEAGPVVELVRVAARARRPLLPLPHHRSSQDRGVAEQGLPPGPRKCGRGVRRDTAAGSLLPEFDGCG